jgi:L-iditol 2-dehydrogenase
VKKLTSQRGSDITIEATGNPQAVVEGMRMTRDQGTYVVVGQYTDAGDVVFNPHNDLNKKHLTIKGSWGSDFSHFYKAVQFVANHQNEYPWEKIISRMYSLDEVQEALDDVAQMVVMKAVISPNM